MERRLIVFLESESIRNSELLFRGSRNGWNTRTFHSLCDNKGATEVIYKSTEGKIFGGYTNINWDSSRNYRRDSGRSFIFSLTHNTKHSHHTTMDADEILCNPGYGLPLVRT